MKTASRILLPFLLSIFCIYTFASDASADIHITLDKSHLSFGTISPGGQSVPQVISCRVQSTEPLPWTITLQARPEAGTPGFPSENFRYWFTGPAPGRQSPPFSTDAPVPLGPAIIYAAPESQYVTDNATFELAFKIVVSPNQRPGNYSFSIVISVVNGV